MTKNYVDASEKLRRRNEKKENLIKTLSKAILSFLCGNKNGKDNYDHNSIKIKFCLIDKVIMIKDVDANIGLDWNRQRQNKNDEPKQKPQKLSASCTI